MSDPRTRARRSLRSRAILHETVTATGVDIDDALIAAAHRTRTGIPLPRLLSCGHAAVRWVEVWVDIGLSFAACVPTITAKTLKLLIRKRFMISSFGQQL